MPTAGRSALTLSRATSPLQALSFLQASGVILACTYCDLTIKMTNRMLRATNFFKGLNQHVNSLASSKAGWEQRTLLPKRCLKAELS